MKQLREATIEALDQTRVLIETIAGHEEGQGIYKQAGIGRHVRHILDHFLVFRSGLDGGQIDYNKRNRDSEVEVNLFLACKMLDELKHWAASTKQLEDDRPITIVSEVSCSRTINTRIDSSVKREMHYVNYHCIHHLAFCALLAKQHGIESDPAIGLAPGTATHFRALGALGA